MAHIVATPLCSPPNTTLTPKKQLIRNEIDNNNEKISVEARLAATVADGSAVNLEKLKPKSYKIWMSNNVVVENPKKGMLKREWHYKGVRRLIVLSMMHVLAMFGPLTFSRGAFLVALVLHVVIGFGLTLSFHRNLSHKSFTLPKWLEYLFAYIASLALQGDPIGWVSTHRFHHKFADSERDPHSPTQGFWYGYIYWVFDHNALAEKRGGTSMAKDMETQQFYRFMRSTYILHHIALGLLLYKFGGFSYVVWGMGVRSVWGFHSVFLVNSVCHVWGYQSWNTGDFSTNNWVMAIVAVGDGWHNNHHAFEYSARHGLEWWEIDLTWYCVKLLETFGLAKDVKLPTLDHQLRLTFKNKKT